MGRFHNSSIAAAALAASLLGATPSHAISGTVRVTIAKAGFVVGAGGGRGILTFRHRNYPFTVQGLSLGITAGASINKLVGRADYINELSDFAGTYSVIGAGGALVGGVGGVQLKGRDLDTARPQGRPRTLGQYHQGRDHAQSVPFNPRLTANWSRQT